MARIGVGVLSFAHGHVGAYCHQMKGFDDVTLVAGWDANPERGKRNTEAFGMEFVPNLETLLADSRIQAVFVSSETSEHADLAVAAAEAGKMIVIQKPLAFRLEDCDRIIAAVRKAGVRATVAYQMRFDPANLAMRKMVQDGTLGRIGLLRRRHCIGVLFSPEFTTNPETHWHIEAEKNMGMVMDDASHAADFVYWVLGMPVSVMAEIDNVLTNVAPDDTGVLLFRHESGAMSTIVNSSVTLAAINTTEIYGDKGVVVQDYGDGPSCGPPRPEGAVAVKHYDSAEPANGLQPLDIPIPPGGHGDRIHAVARPMVDWLLDENAPPPCPLEEARCSVEMVLGAYESSRTGRRVTFPLG